MELRDFIKTTLLEIVNAVEDVKNELKEKNRDNICPPPPADDKNAAKMHADAFSGRYYQNVEFDVAVSAEDSRAANGKLGVKVLSIEANIGGNSMSNNLITSRIKFHVPISLNCEKL